MGIVPIMHSMQITCASYRNLEIENMPQQKLRMHSTGVLKYKFSWEIPEHKLTGGGDNLLSCFHPNSHICER